MDREKFSIRRKSIKSVDEDLLESEILFLTGRCDRYGHQIAIFPNKANDLLSTKYSPADVIVLIRYYYSLCYHGKHTRGLAFVVNLHQWKKTGIQVLVDALDMAQDYHRGTVGALYAIQPRTKYLQKHFKKLTGLRTSKCNPKVPCYETVCVSVPSELLSFMDVRQLTADFGGALKYNHRAWITFMKTIDDLEENVNRALDKLPEAHDKMAILAQCQIPDTKPEIAAVLSNVYRKSKAIMRDLNLEQLIDECKEVIKALTDPSIEPNYAEIKDTATFTEAKNNIEQYLKQLVSSRNDLRQAWNDAEVRILHTVKMKKCMNTAEELMSWINNIGIPAVKEPAEIADCLSNAEILKTEYETGFLNIAKKVLSQSEYIQHMLEDNCKKQTTSNVQLLYRRFCEAVEHFRKLVLSKHRVYLNVYDFYLTAHKSPLSKIPVHQGCNLYEFIIQTMKWYHQTVNFIPLHLLFCEQECVFSSHYILHGTAAWHAAVSDYQLYHPPPKTDHLTKLISILPVLDTRIKLQVRLLIHRVKVLRMLLENCSKVDIEDLESVWKWKRQVKSGSDDITLDLDTKVLDLLSVGQMPSETQEQHRPGSASGLKIAPKLKSASDREVRGATPETKVGRCDVRWQSANIQASPRTSSDDESQVSDQVFEADRKLSPGSERYISLGYVNNSGYESNLKHFNSKRIRDHQSCSGLSNDSGLLTSLSNPHLEKCSHSEHNQTQDVSGYSWNMPVLNHAPLDRVVTVNDVYNSNLDAEEKLDIMAKICSGNFKVNEEIYYKLKPDPQAMSSAKPHRSKLRISDAERSALSESRVQVVSKPESVLTNVNAETSKVGGISETLSKRAVRRIPARRRVYKKSSIKVEEWMQKLEHQVEMSWPQKVQKSKVTHGGHSSPRNEEAATSHDVATASPQQVRNEDPEVTECSLIDSDTEDLDAIDKQLTELSLEEEQEEFLLKECEPVLPTSPVSMLSSSTSHKSETELAADEPKQRCPLVDVPHISTPVDGDGMDAQHEGSLSEESGVYTQSTDSRPRLSTYPSYPGSNFGLNYIQPAHSTLHPSRPERLQVMNEASLGDSSSQTTVMTEICRKPSTRQNSSEAANEQLASTSKANIEDTQDDSVDLDDL